MRKTILVATIGLLLLTLGCQPKPQAQEAPAVQPSNAPASQPSETPAVKPGMEMIEPAVTFTAIQVSTDTVSIAPHPRPSDCPQLEFRLYELSVAEDHVDFAQTTGLFYDGGATRVVIQLATPETDTSFLGDYGAQIETQTESLVQALVPVGKLCDLSNDPRVRFVREPHTPTLP